MKIQGGEIDEKERKRDGMALIAFIKDNLTGAQVSREIEGNIAWVEEVSIRGGGSEDVPAELPQSRSMCVSPCGGLRRFPQGTTVEGFGRGLRVPLLLC